LQKASCRIVILALGDGFAFFAVLPLLFQRDLDSSKCPTELNVQTLWTVTVIAQFSLSIIWVLAVLVRAHDARACVRVIVVK